MGEFFNNLCKGPIIVIDDAINVKGDKIYKLIAEIKGKNIPIMCAETPHDFALSSLLYSNFVILDWALTGERNVEKGITTGEEAGTAAITFINKLKKICLGPIFIISDLDPEDIKTILEKGGIQTKGNRFVFVERKSSLKDWNSLVSIIESWIKESPLIYLTKWWTNEWLKKNNEVFWDLYELDHNWPSLFYSSFEERGEDPMLGLRDILIQLTSSEIDIASVDSSFLKTGAKAAASKPLDNLYMRLVYTTKNINNDIRPGDIFKSVAEGKKQYLLNIRPECDTTVPKNGDEEIMLYLLEGKPIRPEKDRYNAHRGQLEPWGDEILLLHLDNKKMVRFDKNKLKIISLKEMQHQGYVKICRIVPPLITQIRQSYSNYIARYGLPSYPRQIVDSLFPPAQSPEISSEAKSHIKIIK
jgi:hypothetical protein